MKNAIEIIVIGWLISGLTAGCTWVDLKPRGGKVRVLTVEEVGSCQELGRVSAVTAAQIGFIARGRDTVQEEVYRLARNNAGDMGGDTIIPAGPLIDGEQPFKVYRCINP
jgi:hypothetical protein